MAKIIEYKCPNCGGAISFDTSSQGLKCPYCDSEFDVSSVLEDVNDTISSDSMEWETAEPEQIGGDGMFVTYICASCGGEIVCDSNTAASTCPFCGNNVVISEKVSGIYKPDFVLPFKFDKMAAKDALENFYKGKKLLPDSFSDRNRIDEIKGIYVPFWIYSCTADVDMRLHATRVRFWSDSRYNYTETSHYRLIRSGFLTFDGVPVDSSQKIPNDVMESLEPFDYSEGVDFDTAYLSGFFADKYDVESKDCEERANERIRSSAYAAFSSTAVGYASVVPESSSIKFNNGIVRYALLPVWMLTTTYEGKRYTFAMNGQTGKFVGDLPVDKGKFWKYFMLYGGIGAAIMFMILSFI